VVGQGKASQPGPISVSVDPGIYLMTGEPCFGSHFQILDLLCDSWRALVCGRDDDAQISSVDEEEGEQRSVSLSMYRTVSCFQLIGWGYMKASKHSLLFYSCC